MPKRFLASGVAVLAGGLVAVLLWPRSDGPVSRARCERVQVGMTLEEVVAVLGGPPGDYRTGEVELDLRELDDGFHSIMTSMEVLLGERHFRHEWWQGDGGTLWALL